MTKRDALMLTAELWFWLAEDGTRRKFDWPGWARVGEMMADCPCCEYKIHENGMCSDTCPLVGWWGENALCVSGKGLFGRWIFEVEHRPSIAAHIGMNALFVAHLTEIGEDLS